MLNETSSNSDPASPLTKAILASVYFTVFLISELGNGFVIFSLILRKDKRNRRNTMDYFVLNLATTDFVFNTLSMFNCVEYLLDEWKFGVILCKVHSQFMEITYTVSTLTLATISFTRYKVANAVNPFILAHNKKKVKRNIWLIWFTSFIFSLPLLHAYTVVLNKGYRYCTNLNFNDVTRQTYYLVQGIVLFFIPLTIMLISQHKITRTMRWQSGLANTVIENRGRNDTGISNLNNGPQPQTSERRPRANFSRRSAMAEKRITKILTWVWIVFTFCWAPFIIYRTLDYFTDIREKGKIWNQLWYLCQLLILLNAAINPFLYYRIMNRGFASPRKATFTNCCCICRRKTQVVSTSNRRPNQEIS